MGPNCKNPMFSGLTADQKRKILERHNLLRQVVKDGQVYNIKAERLPPVDSTTMMPLVIRNFIKKTFLIPNA